MSFEQIFCLILVLVSLVASYGTIYVAACYFSSGFVSRRGLVFVSSSIVWIAGLFTIASHY